MLITYPYRNNLSAYAAGFVGMEGGNARNGSTSVPVGVLGPGYGTEGGNDTTASQISHVIYRGHFSRYLKNVAIPTMQIQCLNESSRNYVRNWCVSATAARDQAGHGHSHHNSAAGVEGAGGTGGHSRGARGGGAWAGNIQTPRPIGGRREACGAWPDTSATQHRRGRRCGGAPEGLEGPAAVPVGGGGAWPGFETTHQAHASTPGPTGVEGAGGTGGHGRASRRGAERSEAA